MTRTDPWRIAGPQRLTPVAAKLFLAKAGALRPLDAAAYIDALWALCGQFHLDFLCLFAQACEESNNFSHVWWRDRLNAVNIGVTGDPAQNAASPTFAHAGDAAIAHVVHLLAYLGPRNGAELAWLAANRHLDPRYGAVLDAGFGGMARVVDDLTGAWAVDPNYGVAIADRGNAILAFAASLQQGGTTVLGKVQKPPMAAHHAPGIPGQNSYAARMQRQGKIKGTFTHTPVGTYLGTIEYFVNDANCLGLTDAFIGGPHDGQYNGVIAEIIPETSTLVPYANGVVNEAVPAYGDGARFIAAYGIEPAVNAYAYSVEVSDNIDPTIDRGPLHQPQIDSYCWLMAYWHFAVIGQDPTKPTGQGGLDYRCYHDETGSSHQGCPGPWFEQHADDTFQRIIDIGLAYMHGAPLDPPLIVTHPPGWTGAKVPDPVAYWAALTGGGGTQPTPTPQPEPYATPNIPPWLTDAAIASGEDQRMPDGSVVRFIQHIWTVKRRTRRRQVAALNAHWIGPDLMPGERFMGYYQINAADGHTYVLTKGGTRVLMDDLTEHITITS